MELAVIAVGERVQVQGRSASGSWFYVSDAQSVKGFAYADRFEWSGDIDALPVKAPSVTTMPVTRTPTPGGTYITLSIDLWQLAGTERCDVGRWYQSVWIQGQGGDGVYTYYWNDEQIAGPLTNQGYTFEVRNASGALIGTGRIISGDGQVIEASLYIPEPACAQ